MAQIIISKLAIEKIIDDPEFRQLKETEAENATPLLYYYQRSFSTLKDGTKIQHGDGFMLTYVNPEEIRETDDIAYKSVVVADGVELIVGGARAVISSNFNIGWLDAKFTFEPQIPS